MSRVFFFQQKGKKSPDYEHCMWGEGRICFVSQLFCLGFTNFWVRQQSKPIDCVRLCSVNKLCRGFENKKNTRYIKVTGASKSSLSLIFDISLTKNQEFEIKSSIWLYCPNIFVQVGFNWFDCQT